MEVTQALDRLEATDSDGLAAEVFREYWVWPAGLAVFLSLVLAWRDRHDRVGGDPAASGWLLALPVLALAGWWLWRRQGSLGGLDAGRRSGLLGAMAALGRVDTGAGRRPMGAALAVAALAVLALAGPAVERRDSLSFRNLDGVLFVVDASPSVTGSERWPQMLTMGRFGIAALGTRPGG